MKSSTWNDVLLAEHRGHLQNDEARAAFDVLVAAASDLMGFECAPAMQGEARIFTYNDTVSAERPFAFIVNRKHLLFYVRKPGFSRVLGGLKALKSAFQSVSENPLGEWTIPIATEEQAARLQGRLFPEGARSAVTKRGIPDGITRSDVLQALEQLDAGVTHRFGESLKYDLIYEKRRYAPKAVVGLAAARAAGRVLNPEDFSGGQDSKAVKILRDLGFEVGPKALHGEAASDRSFRTDQAAAGEVFESIIGGLPTPLRSLAIASLRHSIQYAREHNPDRWILTLHPGYVRFIAGMVQCLQYRKDGRASILLLRKGAPRNLRRGSGEYKNAPDCIEVYPSLAELVSRYEELRLGHERAIQICAEHRPVIGSHRRGHAPGLLSYLESLDDGAESPDPDTSGYWWVNHKQTYGQETSGNYLWSPKVNQNKARNQSYDNMARAVPGDVVFSYAHGLIQAIGVVSGPATTAPKPNEFGTTGENWDKEGWRLPVSFTKIDSPLRPKDHMDSLAPLLPATHSPIRSSGDGNQGIYLAEIPAAMAAELRQLLDGQLEKVETARAPVGQQGEDQDSDAIADRAVFARTDIGPTQKQTLVDARRGQGLFRERVISLESRCRITGVDIAAHLRASHIKPWKVASDQERLDGNNGLLIAPHIDHLFDQGFISFTDFGDLIVSPQCPETVLAAWGISRTLNVGPFRVQQRAYLAYHRTKVLQK